MKKQASNNPLSVADLVRSARNARGLSHEQMGQKLGLSATGYGHYERGRQPFTVDMIFRIADVLHVPVIQLLGIESDLSDSEEQILALYREAVKLGLGAIATATLMAIVGNAQYERSTREVHELIGDHSEEPGERR